MITVVDYGVGNIGSVVNMLGRLGYRVAAASTASAIHEATRLILPGVGAFDPAMRRLRQSSLIDPLSEQVLQRRVPILGICLGAQMMTRSSDEGTEPGLGWLAASTRRMDFRGVPGKWPLPNIGWRDVRPINGYRLLADCSESARFYFVHSYYLCADVAGDLNSIVTTYGFEYAAGLCHNHIHAVQFHPEKSHRFGMRLLKNFVEFG